MFWELDIDLPKILSGLKTKGESSILSYKYAIGNNGIFHLKVLMTL